MKTKQCNKKSCTHDFKPDVGFCVHYVDAEYKQNKICAKHNLKFHYMDLDFFKELNDSHGHQEGDNALVGFAGVLQQNFPKAVNVRMGGDEFVVAMRGEVTEESVREQLDRFLESVHEFFASTEAFSGLSVSIGVAMGEKAGIPLDVLLHQGDVAMYEAKKGGKNRYCFYSDDMYKADI